MKTDNFTSLGSILIAMDLVTEDELNRLLIEQKTNRIRLGEILVLKGIISEEQLGAAIAAQNRLRGKNKYKQSMAMAELAINRHNRGSAVVKRREVQEKAEKITDEYPEIDKLKHGG